MRDLLLQLAVYASLPAALYRPYFGLLLYSWLSYMRPQEFAWGVSREMPMAQAVAIATILGLLLQFRSERPFALRPQSVLLIALFGWISLSVWTAVQPGLATNVYGLYWKAILISLITTGLVRTRARLRGLFLVIAFSLGLLGAKFAMFGILRGGTRFDHGHGGMINDNNSLAVVLAMMVPLLVGIALTESAVWLRLTAAFTAVLSVVTIFFTFSRSGLLALVMVCALLVLRSRNRAWSAVVLGLGLSAFVAFSPGDIRESYLTRAGTILNYENDQSVIGRFVAWEASWEAFKDHPLLGVGPDNFQAVYRRYSETPEVFHVAHNAALQLLSESGLPALLLFLGLIGTALWRLERLRRRYPAGWAEVYARVLQISIVGYLTGAMFLNLAYLELIFHLLGLSVSLELAAEHEHGLRAQPATRSRLGADAWWRRPAPETG